MHMTDPLPAPVATGLDYYTRRAEDYANRHSTTADGKHMPPYYLQYGDKYCRRFCLQLRSWLTPTGQQWVDRTCLRLQQTIEQTCMQDPTAFAALEEDPKAFCNWAYATHAAAYIESGIADLPLYDLMLILFTIDYEDLTTPAGLQQASLVLSHLIYTRISQMVTGIENLCRAITATQMA